MLYRRRFLDLAAGTASLAMMPLSASAGSRVSPDPAEGGATVPATAFTRRALGTPSAPVKVTEFFSLNCPHCAEFGMKTLPLVIKHFVDTGKVYYEFVDYPLNGDALWAAEVARSLPPREYLPFVDELFRTQPDWAFSPSLKTPDEFASALFRYAALAGMSHERFLEVIRDKRLRAFIIGKTKAAEKKYHIDATPSFVINGRLRVGAVSFGDFSRWIRAA